MPDLAEPISIDSIETERASTSVLITHMRGRMTQAMADGAFDEFLSLLDEQPCAIWIIGQLQLSGFESKAVRASARWFSAFAARAGAAVIFASQVPGAWMVAASLAFAAHMKISNCNTVSEAYARAGVTKL